MTLDALDDQTLLSHCVAFGANRNLRARFRVFALLVGSLVSEYRAIPGRLIDPQRAPGFLKAMEYHCSEQFHRMERLFETAEVPWQTTRDAAVLTVDARFARIGEAYRRMTRLDDGLPAAHRLAAQRPDEARQARALLTRNLLCLGAPAPV